MPTLDRLYGFSLVLIAAGALLALPVLLLVSAPYGRYARPGYGPRLNTLLAWLLMEAPPPIVFTVVFFMGPNAWHTVPLLLLALWLAHYVDRSLIFPLRMRSAPRAQPITTVVLALLFNFCNALTNGYAIGTLATHLTGAWLTDVRFVFGLLLFVAGYTINRHADAVLRNLRRPGETGYKIPFGGAFRWVSCANYFGELVEWAGFALAAWTPAAALFLFFTAANLMPRALSHHRWYREHFPDYPAERRAIFPFLL